MSSGSPAAPRARPGHSDAAANESLNPTTEEQPEATFPFEAAHDPTLLYDYPFADYPGYLDEDYVSDGLDMSDDGGAPLMNYLDVANILTGDLNIDPSPSGQDQGDFDYTHDDHDDTEDQDHPYHIPLEAAVLHPPHFAVLDPHLLNQADASFPVPLDDGFGDPQTLLEPEDDPGPWLDVTPPNPTNNQNMNPLAPNNYNLVNFLYQWAAQSRCLNRLGRERKRFPWYTSINQLTESRISNTRYQDLSGDRYDLQGIDWEHLGVTRRDARERRRLTYNNYVNREKSDRWHPLLPDVLLPRTGNYFRFRKMDMRRDMHLAHFQLRNLLAVSSRSRVFYPGSSAIQQFNPISAQCGIALDFEDNPAMQVSTLAAGHGFLIAGGFTGEYLLRHLNSDERPEEYHEGNITNHASGITNHVQIQECRTSGSPRAAFSSNDMGFRILDLATQQYLSEEMFSDPLNCSALSPDRRLRVMVGDRTSVFITMADGEKSRDGKPQILHELKGHRDFGFSCDWADDGWTVATGFQDKTVKIWDARRWTDSQGKSTPVCTLRTEMAGVRCLKFSPLGSGKRVLVATEEADFVNIIDAQTFRSKQTIDIFGEIGGAGFANDGQDLYVLCCDGHRGGLIQLERCDLDGDDVQDMVGMHDPRHRWWRRVNGPHDWPENFMSPRKVPGEAERRRKRRATTLMPLDPF